jgi:hypothetical protein
VSRDVEEQAKMAHRKKSRGAKSHTEGVTNAEHQQLLADITRIINAWEKHAPGEKFAGMTVEEFRQATRPSFEADAEIARLEWEMERLKKLMGEEIESPRKQ